MRVTIDGHEVDVPEGCSVLAAIARAGVTVFRRSVTGQPRGPLCGMGTCFECRVTIDGQPDLRSCQLPCEPGMDVRTHG